MTVTLNVEASPEATLEAWRARAAQLSKHTAPSGVARYEQMSHLSGLELYQAVLAGKLPPPPICDTVDFSLVEVESGRIVFQGTPLQRHYNPMGTVHGGWISTLLDSALACAIHTRLPVGKIQTTAELKVNFVRALTDRVPLVRAEGKVIHLGGRMGTSDARLYGADGRLYAHASTTCFIYDLTETLRRTTT